MTGSDTTHECPAPGCTHHVPFERLACPRHWFKVRPGNRRSLLRLWRDKPGSDEYFACRAACLLDMGVAPADVASLNGGVAL